MIKKISTISLTLPVIWLFLSGVIFSQEPYRLPPEEIVEILDAPPTPLTLTGPRGEYLLFVERRAMPEIRDLAIETLELAGSRINPATNAFHSPSGRNISMHVMEIETGVERELQVPDDANLGMFRWSPDGKYLTFSHTRDDGVELWISEIGTGESRRLGDFDLNATSSQSVQWIPDGKSLLVLTVPGNREGPPEPDPVPIGPVVQEADGRPAPARTFQNLLSDAHDEKLLEYYFTSQLVEVVPANNEIREIGEKAIFRRLAPSPDGRYILVERIVPPYSYLLPRFGFPYEVEVWNREGELKHHLTSNPSGENVPLFGVLEEPRNHRWSPLKDARIVYVQALDGGDPNVEVDYRDQLFTIDAPFEGEPEPWVRTGYRYQSIVWGKGVALLNEFDRPTFQVRTWKLDPDDIGQEPILLFERNAQDRYNDPGTPVMTLDERGNSILLHGESADEIFLRSSGASPAGDFPFLDLYSLTRKEGKRIWQADETHYEYVVDILDRKGERLITRRESNEDPPNYFIRSLNDGSLKAMTHFEDPAPQLTGIHRELITYEREDGLTLSATLYLPPDHSEGDQHPLVVWIYPMDFVSPDAAGQVRGSPNRFTFFRGSSHLFFLTQGYAVLDGPALPIVGEYGNDTYVEQLKMGIEAAIEKVNEMGVADIEQMGVGGHSYGAFSTANLIAHTDYFKAGIARSGAYNRTLTPFGFQFERRTFWEATDTYINVSPFSNADKINQPLLIIHGMDDSNPGTFPVQSERLFHAIRGLGGVAKYVQYPYEEHGYRARESILDLLYYMIEWFDMHVLN